MSLLESLLKSAVEINKHKDDSTPSTLDKRAQLSIQIRNTVPEIIPEDMHISERAKMFYLKGCLDEWNRSCETAHQAWIKAVKLDPSIVDAWNMLGFSFCRKSDFTSAKNCYQCAVSETANKESLRQLSMVLRQIGSGEELKQNIRISIEKAKDAVAIDIKDSVSWYILGNAYLSHFFLVSQDPTDLSLSLKAYKQSESLDTNHTNPDLYYNRATVFRYLEEFSLSLEDLRMASTIDPSWRQPTEMHAEIIDYLKRIQECIQKKAYMKVKKFQAFIESIKQPTMSFRDSLEHRTGCDLLVVRLVMHLSPASQAPSSVLVVDFNGDFAVLSLRSISSSAVKIGDLISIRSPLIRIISVQYSSQELGYTSVSIRQTADVMINNHPISTQLQNQPTLKVELFPV